MVNGFVAFESGKGDPSFLLRRKLSSHRKDLLLKMDYTGKEVLLGCMVLVDQLRLFYLTYSNPTAAFLLAKASGKINTSLTSGI